MTTLLKDTATSHSESRGGRDRKSIDFQLETLRKTTILRAGAAGSEPAGAAGIEKVSIVN
jgi:hypothetical protein